MGRIYIFGEWELDTRLSELRCDGKPLKLGRFLTCCCILSSTAIASFRTRSSSSAYGLDSSSGMQHWFALSSRLGGPSAIMTGTSGVSKRCVNTAIASWLPWKSVSTHFQNRKRRLRCYHLSRWGDSPGTRLGWSLLLSCYLDNRQSHYSVGLFLHCRRPHKRGILRVHSVSRRIV